MTFIAKVCAENIMVLIEQETIGLSESEISEVKEILVDNLKEENNNE